MVNRGADKPVANQFIITTSEGRYFQSYESVIAYIPHMHNDYHITKDIDDQIMLDEKYWDYSNTTSKYRSIFLGENTNDTKKKIASGEYLLTNLNK